MSDLALLRSFIAVYRTGTVSGAAEQLQLAQPTVTMHVRALETELGRTLFTRHARGVEPRLAAHELAAAVGTHIDALDEVLFGEVIGRSRRGGVLYVGGPSEYMKSMFLPALAPLVQRGVRIRAMLDVNQPIVERLLAGELDLAILTELVDESALEVTRHHTEEFVLVASQAHAARIGPVDDGPAGAERLLDEPLLAFSEGLPLIQHYWRHTFDTRWVGSPAIVANSLSTLATLVEQGAGISVFPRHMIERSLAAGSLVALHEPVAPSHNVLYLAWHVGALAHPSIRTARALLTQLHDEPNMNEAPADPAHHAADE
jgi:DNA-binding transcriptional LysR family regulator